MSVEDVGGSSQRVDELPSETRGQAGKKLFPLDFLRLGHPPKVLPVFRMHLPISANLIKKAPPGCAYGFVFS